WCFPETGPQKRTPVAGAFALIDYVGALRLRHAPTQVHERADHQHAQAEHAECAGFRSVDGVTDNQRKTLLCAGAPRPRVGPRVTPRLAKLALFQVKLPERAAPEL